MRPTAAYAVDQPPTARGKPRGQWSARACWATTCLLIIVHFAVLLRYATNVPYSDDYDNIVRFYKQVDELAAPQLIRVLFAQHNEHRLLFNRLVFLAERTLTGGTDLRRLIVLGNLGTLALLAVFAWQLRRDPGVSLATCVAAAFLLQPAAYESTYWAMDVLQRNYVMVFALLCCTCLARDDGRGLAAAAFFACLGLYTQASGAVAPLVGSVWLLLRALQGRHAGGWTRLAAWLLINAIALGGYSVGYYTPADHPPLAGVIAHPLAAGEYLLVYIGAGAGYLGLEAAIAAGIGVIGLFLYLTWQRFFHAQPALYAFIAFLLTGAVVTAVGRSSFGLEQALSSRYALTSCALMACALGSATAVLRKKTRTAAVGILSLALVDVSLSYAYNLPLVRLHREHLLTGASLLYHRRIAAGLDVPAKIQAAKLLIDMQAHGYYAWPREVTTAPAPAGEYPRLAVVPFQGSPHAYAGGSGAARVGGAVSVQAAAHTVHVVGQTDISDGDVEGVLYVLTPVLPESISGGERAGAGVSPDHTGPGAGGFEMTLNFPSSTDTQVLVGNMCLGYESLSTPPTLFAGNPPICEQRLLEHGRGESE